MQINLHEEEMDKCLFDALYALMQTMPIEEISVGDILAKAHVSRSSFYRRYRDKYELLTAGYKRLMDNTFLQCMTGRPWKESAVALYHILEEHPEFFKHAIARRGADSLYQFICEVILGCMAERLCAHGVDLHSDWRLLSAAKAYIYGTMDVTCEWAQANMPYPADELIQWLCEIMPECLKPYCI